MDVIAVGALGSDSSPVGPGVLSINCAAVVKAHGEIMSDDLSRQKPADPNRINIHEEWELAYWTKLLGTTEGDLRNAVQAVGPHTDAVRKHFDKRQRSF
jgi:hypothetical protein